MNSTGVGPRGSRKEERKKRKETERERESGVVVWRRWRSTRTVATATADDSTLRSGYRDGAAVVVV